MCHYIEIGKNVRCVYIQAAGVELSLYQPVLEREPTGQGLDEEGRRRYTFKIQTSDYIL